MSVRLVGNHEALLAIRKKLLESASDDTRRRLNEHLARESIKLVHLGFRQQVAPDGTPWAPLKRKRGRQGKKKRSDVILQDTRILRNSFTMRRATADGFIVGSSLKYAQYHQWGTRGLQKSYTRVQPVTDPSRHKPLPESATAREKALRRLPKFMKRAKAAKQKRGVVHFRVLHFKEGTGKIPPRPMIPQGELPERWAKPLERRATRFLKKALTPT